MTTSRGASAEAIQFHYDLANEFYALWLDSSMTYTCALFADGEDATALHQAQMRKLDDHAAQAGVVAGARVLDIGCGWGGMLRRLLRVSGASQVVGLTLSAQQKTWIEGEPDPRLEVRLEDWQDHNPAEPYDAIVSVEAMEAFVRPGQSTAERVAVYRKLFDRCRSWLRPGGMVSLQTIAYGNARPEDLDRFISEQIFPESDLPRLAEIAEAIEQRFEIVRLVNDRAQYLRTVRAWLARLRSNRTAAISMVGPENVQRYEEYLRLCTYMFASGSCDLYRIALRRIDRPHVTRRTTN
ncbi:MAG: cyclopropane-fatty-acyl-phospholipid synthase [Aliidongia sp.]|jgi:cyclopropane-fatty-acyl-phospholipid synthase|nr:cyclopropane-fatty-acyl-phospholipid synthase [Aliidongia sp.]